MTVEPICFVCGKEGLFIDGLCPDCHMNELRSPGAAFAATFGALADADRKVHAEESGEPHGEYDAVGKALRAAGILDDEEDLK